MIFYFTNSKSLFSFLSASFPRRTLPPRSPTSCRTPPSGAFERQLLVRNPATGGEKVVHLIRASNKIKNQDRRRDQRRQLARISRYGIINKAGVQYAALRLLSRWAKLTRNNLLFLATADLFTHCCPRERKEKQLKSNRHLPRQENTGEAALTCMCARGFN